MTTPEPDRTVELEVVSVRGFDEFYSSERDQIYRGVALVIGDVNLAKDAVDEAMARAWRRWATVGKYARPEGWVYRVAINCAISSHRKVRREVVGLEGADRVIHDPLPYPELADAVDRLPVKLRAVIVARYYLDWSEEMVARSLGIAKGTVKSRTNRAIERLAEQLR